MSFEGKIDTAVARHGALAVARPALWLIAPVIVAAAMFEQVRLGLNTDVSWLLTVGEQMLDGKRLYLDIFEVNPPASVWIYLPGIMIGRALGLPAEFATAALTFLLAGLSLAGAARLLRLRDPLVAAAAAFAFLLLPGICFAQREHVALLTLLPFMAVLSLRMQQRPVRLAVAVIAGAGCGITLSIKPHFVLAVAPMLLLVAWRRRSAFAAMGAEAWAGAGVVVAYVAAVAIIYPNYFTDAVPLLAAVYVPARTGLTALALMPAVLMFAAAASTGAIIGRSRLLQSPAALPLLAALGFAAAMAVQGKGYFNHAYPPLALALFGLALLLAEGFGDRLKRRFGAAVLGLTAMASLFVFDFGLALQYPEVAQVVRRVGPPNPRILVAGTNLSVGHPLTRLVDGEWVGRRGSLWASGGAVQLRDSTTDPEQRALLQSYIDDDRRIFVEDLQRGRPDIVLVPRPSGSDWIAKNPDVARAMAPYQAAGRFEDIDVMVRRPAG